MAARGHVYFGCRRRAYHTDVCLLELENAGYEVISAFNVPEAMALLERKPHHFSALVTDFNMSLGLSGADLIVHMRQTYPGVPMILSTAVIACVSGDFLQQHHVRLLEKPYAPEALVAMMRQALGQGSGSDQA